MQYRLLGNSGLRVSEAALGTMTFGEDWGWGSPKGEARKVYDAFRRAGGNFIDNSQRERLLQVGRITIDADDGRNGPRLAQSKRKGPADEPHPDDCNSFDDHGHVCRPLH